MKRQTASGAITLGVYSQSGQLVYEENGARSIASEHIYLVGSLLATCERAYSASASTTRFQHTDALGSPVAVTDLAAQVVERMSYEPYGLMIGKPSHDGIGYTGHVQDAATGLTYMQQRYYDPMLGVFLSVDPITAYGSPIGQFHRYRYANGNPYKFTDPDGRVICNRVILSGCSNNLPHKRGLPGNESSCSRSNACLGGGESKSKTNEGVNNLGKVVVRAGRALKGKAGLGVGLKGRARLGPLQLKVGPSLKYGVEHNFLHEMKWFSEVEFNAFELSWKNHAVGLNFGGEGGSDNMISLDHGTNSFYEFYKIAPTFGYSNKAGGLDSSGEISAEAALPGVFAEGTIDLKGLWNAFTGE